MRLSARNLVLLCLACGVAAALLPNSARAQSLQDQQMCAAQANKVDEEAAKELAGSQSFLVDHQSYYNAKLGTCLVLIVQRFRSPIADAYTLQDAFGGHVFARKGPLGECWVNFTGQKQTCNSEDEFLSLITPYFHK